jgi:hypothetical protein
MANTYTLISANTLSTTATSVTFSSIPATYTDLVFRISARGDFAANGGKIRVEVNGDTATNYSWTEIYATGTTDTSARNTNKTDMDFYSTNYALDGTNLFSNTEIYIPNYLASANKPMNGFGVSERNSTTANVIATTANLWRNTAAITSVKFSPASNSFVSGSSFYLYGIKKD